MEQRKFDEQQLQKMLHALPDRKVPDDLADRIMAEIRKPGNKAGSLFNRLLNASLTFDVRPVRLAGSLCTLAAAFWLGLIFGDYSSDRSHIEDPAPAFSPLASENAEAAHLMGRSLLEDGRAQQAITFFRQASLIAPQNPEYALWEGVAFGRNSDKEREQEVYKKIIRRYPRYLPARIYLGHSLLETGQLEAALAEYSRILALYPEEATALYNRALTCQLMDDRELEAAAWKEYLRLHRNGKWAYRAVEHLNALGDFTYRSYQIGYRKIILNQDFLLAMDAAVQQREIDLLAASFAQSSGNVLHLVVFQADDADLAGKTAMQLHNLVSGNMGGTTDKKIQISWFGNPENVYSSSGMQYQLPEGVLVFSQPQVHQTGEKMI
ncbi:MAG: tetratricopeptide repeat protein [Desulfobulbaceae bacterium]|nr:tetratricopeptide repeat protein [Desulfobulbaceae bacterium]